MQTSHVFHAPLTSGLSEEKRPKNKHKQIAHKQYNPKSVEHTKATKRWLNSYAHRPGKIDNLLLTVGFSGCWMTIFLFILFIVFKYSQLSLVLFSSQKN